MKFGVVIFPGSNCDKDMIYVLKNIVSKKSKLRGLLKLVNLGGLLLGLLIKDYC